MYMCLVVRAIRVSYLDICIEVGSRGWRSVWLVSCKGWMPLFTCQERGLRDSRMELSACQCTQSIAFGCVYLIAIDRIDSYSAQIAWSIDLRYIGCLYNGRSCLILFTSPIKVAVRRFETRPITARVTNSRARLHTHFQTFGTLFSSAFPPSPPRGRPLKGANISQS